MLIIKDKKLDNAHTKVCVPVEEGSADIAVAEIQSLDDDGCELIEWRLDALDNPLDIGLISSSLKKLSQIKAILILTMRTKHEGGRFDISGDDLVSYYRGLDALSGFDLLDVQYNDVDDQNILDSFEKSIVLSLHDFEKTPSEKDILDLYGRLKQCGTAIVKFAFMPHNPADVAAVMNAGAKLQKESPESLRVLISMGQMGAVTRALGSVYGCAFNFGCKDGKASAPGQMDYKTLKACIEASEAAFAK